MDDCFILDEDATVIFNMLHSIFGTNVTLTRVQYVESIRASSIFPEAQLWLEALVLTIEDWLAYKENQNFDNTRIMLEIESWVFSNSFGMDMLSDTMYLVFGMEPDLFKTKFKDWLRNNKPEIPIKLFPSINKPFEVLESISNLLV